MAKMSAHSRSFLRYREHAEFIGRTKSFKNESKRELIDFMKRFNYDDRTVYFAENIQTLTKDEMKSFLSLLSHRLEQVGATGVIEFHPTADKTSKSAHIHFWGKHNEQIEKTIVNFIKEHKLSNKSFINYTNEKMYESKTHAIKNDEIIEYEFDRSDLQNIERKIVQKSKIDEDEIAILIEIKKDNFLDDIIAFCDDVIENFDMKKRQKIETKEESKELDMNTIFRYIDDLEMDLL